MVNKGPTVPDVVLGDRFRIEHVISNLISNAIKFSPCGAAIGVDVSVENFTDDLATVLLVVKVCMYE